MLTDEVRKAIQELRASFADHHVDVEEDGQGGAYVTVHDLDFGARLSPARGWLGFIVGFHYPAADVYPLFGPPLTMADGSTLTGPFQGAKWRDKPSTQISRRSNARRDEVDTAATKLTKVLEWLRTL